MWEVRGQPGLHKTLGYKGQDIKNKQMQQVLQQCGGERAEGRDQQQTDVGQLSEKVGIYSVSHHVGAENPTQVL